MKVDDVFGGYIYIWNGDKFLNNFIKYFLKKLYMSIIKIFFLMMFDNECMWKKLSYFGKVNYVLFFGKI